MQENHPIEFQESKTNDYYEYYLSVCNQTNFLQHSLYDTHPYYFDYTTLYNLGVREAFHMDDNSWIYSLIVEFFALDKSLHIIAPNLKEIDSSMEPIDIYWSHWVNFDNQTGEPAKDISEFWQGGYALALIKHDSVSRFSHAFNMAMTTFTFFIDADEEKLVNLLKQQAQKPTANDILHIAECMVSLKIVEDDEGYYNYIVIHTKDDISDKIKKLIYFMKTFSEKYSEIVMKIASSQDIECNTKVYVDEVAKLRAEIFNYEYPQLEIREVPIEKSILNEESLYAIEWHRLSSSAGLKSAEYIPDLLKEFALGNSGVWDELYNSIARQGDIYTASFYSIPFLLEIIQKSDSLVLITEAYDLLFEVVNGYSVYDEKILYQNESIALKEANYRLALEYLEYYFNDLTNTKDEKLAIYILDLITLFLDREKHLLERLQKIAKDSIITKKVEEVIFEWSC